MAQIQMTTVLHDLGSMTPSVEATEVKEKWGGQREGAHGEREPIMGVWGGAPSRV